MEMKTPTYSWILDIPTSANRLLYNVSVLFCFNDAKFHRNTEMESKCPSILEV
jgi:hypothetical protein